MRLVMIWPLRLSSRGYLKADWHDSKDQGACKWIGEYADWIENKSKDEKGKPRWTRINDYYTDSGRRKHLTPQAKYGEFLYFHPFIQQIFFDKKDSAIAVLEREDISEARIQLREGDVVWRFPVERVNLFLFPTDVAIAAVQLNMPQAEQYAAEHELLLSDLMDILDWSRRIYPPFFNNENRPGLVPKLFEWLPSAYGNSSDFECMDSYLRTTAEKRTTPVARHWRTLMSPLRPEDHDDAEGLCYSQLEDDRLGVLSYIAVDDPQRISPQDWVRLAFCDEHGASNKWPYSRSFLESFDRENCYDRFWDPAEGFTTRYLLTGYSFLAVGRQTDDFFRFVVPQHVEQQYFLLAVLAHMQKASLLGFWKRLADMQQEFEKEKASDESKATLFEAQEWLLVDLSDFISRFYFREVSNQLQGMELFDCMTKQMRIPQLFAEVVQQSEFVRKVLFEQWQEKTIAKQDRIATYQSDLGQLAHKLLPLSIAASVLGLSIGFGKVESALLGLVGAAQVPLPEVVASMALALLLFGLLWFLLFWFSRRLSK